MEKLIVAVLQLDIFWEDKKRNIEKIDTLIKSINKVDLIVLPEMFTSGFTMNAAENAETMEGETIKWLKEKSKQKECSIIGSFIIKEDDKFFNRAIIVNAKEHVFTYDKRHLFRFEGEKDIYTNGEKQLIFNIGKWKIMPQICYDLRFPVWSRNNNHYDVLIYMANWPAKRNNHWMKLLYARAIENQCYVIGCNRIGKDGNKIEYIGNSLVIDPWGNKINEDIYNEEGIIKVEIKKNVIKKYRDILPVYLDNDRFNIIQ